ncbi:hypothetical protein ACFYW8_44520 [Streptomyces sp. NPDC002742]|uniref:hypothetical protein n=1 Tax=Streptomyces sp. NPDC002742 TaxID=3364663 RepID=UPI0036BD9A74
MEFRLHCDLDSLEITRAGTIWGNVWIETASGPFPESRWNDIMVAFVSDVTEALVSIAKESTRCRRVRFYDGPFWLSIDRSNTDTVVVTQGEGKGEIGRMHFPADIVVREVHSSASLLLDACRMRQWGNVPDVVRLTRALELLSPQDDGIG